MAAGLPGSELEADRCWCIKSASNAGWLLTMSTLAKGCRLIRSAGLMVRCKLVMELWTLPKPSTLKRWARPCIRATISDWISYGFDVVGKQLMIRVAFPKSMPR